jgi:hypothetical protein
VLRNRVNISSTPRQDWDGPQPLENFFGKLHSRKNREAVMSLHLRVDPGRYASRLAACSGTISTPLHFTHPFHPGRLVQAV